MLTTLQARSVIREHAARYNASVCSIWTDSMRGIATVTKGDPKRIVTAAVWGGMGAERVVQSINAEYGVGTARLSTGGYIKVNALKV